MCSPLCNLICILMFICIGMFFSKICDNPSRKQLKRINTLKEHQRKMKQLKGVKI